MSAVETNGAALQRFVPTGQVPVPGTGARPEGSGGVEGAQ